MAGVSSTPAWLRAADDQLYLRQVLLVLLQRERTRIAHSATPSPFALPPAAAQPSLTRRILSRSRPPRRLSQTPGPAFYSVQDGKRPENADANRYMDILPYDRTRVCVPCDASASDADARYLNASWVREMHGGKWWIAAQAPLTHTMHTFFSLLATTHAPRFVADGDPTPSAYRHPHPTRVRTVVQLTRHVEGGILKAHAYFPPRPGAFFLVHPDFENGEVPYRIELLESEAMEDEGCTKSTVRVTREGDTSASPFTFRHLLYTAWPDHGVPDAEDRDSLVRFLHLVDRLNKQPMAPLTGPDPDPDPPVFIHCSAGVGRTGTFLAISSLLRHYGFLPPVADRGAIAPLPPSPLGPLPAELREDLVVQEVDGLREQRPAMVQRMEQLGLVYEVLAEAFVLRAAATPGTGV